jgi:calcineurin-like phosphoesterase family protein
MNRFFTSDMHLDHANILRYTHRPQLKDGDLTPTGGWAIGKDEIAERLNRMNRDLVREHNQMVDEDAVVYNLGDFCFKGNERGVACGTTNYKRWMAQLHGTQVLIRGNHDKNNKVDGLDYAVMSAGSLVFLLCHNPSHTVDMAPCADVVLCGHVHTAWAEQFIPCAGVNRLTGNKTRLAINVGVDVRNYRPVKLETVIGITTREIRKAKACHQSAL